MNPLQIREDEIGRKLVEAEQSGELRSAHGYGKPFAPDAGWDQTPEALRMGFKILKNAGVVPPEVELFHKRAAIREALEQATSREQRVQLQAELSTLEQLISLRL